MKVGLEITYVDQVLLLGKGKVFQRIYTNDSRSSLILQLVNHDCGISPDLNTADNKGNIKHSVP